MAAFAGNRFIPDPGGAFDLDLASLGRSAPPPDLPVVQAPRLSDLPNVTPFPGTKVVTNTYGTALGPQGGGGGVPGGSGGIRVDPGNIGGAAPAAAAPQFTFDTDPGVALALAQEQMGLSQSDANLRAARERAIIGFGDPNIASLAGFGLDPQAGTFARQNYLSGNATLARLDKQRDLQRQAVVNQLASRGILFSGDLGYLQGEVAQRHGNQVFDARQALLNYLYGIAEQDLSRRQGIRGGTLQAYQSAYDRYIQNPGAYAGLLGAPGGAPPATGGGVPPSAGGFAAPTAFPRSRPRRNPLSVFAE